MKRLIYLLFLFIGFHLMPLQVSACAKVPVKSRSTSKKINNHSDSNPSKMDCCKNSHSNNTHNSDSNDCCGGKCGGDSCHCPSSHHSILASSFEICNKIIFTYSFEKSYFIILKSNPSAGFYQIFTPPNIS